MILFALLACRSPASPIQTETEVVSESELDGSETETEPSDSASTTDAETEDTEPEIDPDDQDGDGASVDVDCDDTDPAVYPGATEAWNDVDDDCDGRVDGDGDFAGTLTLYATAVYEGERYSWNLSCPMTLTRSGGKLDFLATCTPDPDDDMAQLLLGEEVRITPRRTTVTGSTFDRTVETTSDTWDSSSAELELAWTDFDTIAASYVLDGFSLDMSGSATLLVQ